MHTVFRVLPLLTGPCTFAIAAGARACDAAARRALGRSIRGIPAARQPIQTRPCNARSSSATRISLRSAASASSRASSIPASRHRPLSSSAPSTSASRSRTRSTPGSAASRRPTACTRASTRSARSASASRFPTSSRSGQRRDGRVRPACEGRRSVPPQPALALRAEDDAARPIHGRRGPGHHGRVSRGHRLVDQQAQSSRHGL